MRMRTRTGLKGLRRTRKIPVAKPQSSPCSATLILSPKTAISFVAAIDDCTYIFEGRSPHACGGVHQAAQALGPGGVFGVIAMIAVLVYLVGGCVYQRTVMHQRGWRQLPNYAMWAGIWSFFSVSTFR